MTAQPDGELSTMNAQQLADGKVGIKDLVEQGGLHLTGSLSTGTALSVHSIK
jgi:hypothetical protein